MRMPGPAPKVPRERFVAAWNAASSAREVASALGISVDLARITAYRLRRYGYHLHAFRSMRRATSVERAVGRPFYATAKPMLVAGESPRAGDVVMFFDPPRVRFPSGVELPCRDADDAFALAERAAARLGTRSFIVGMEREES